MILSKLLTVLAQGVLSNLSFVDTTNYTIKNDKIPMVVEAINEGLIELYNIFELKRDFVFLELIDGKVEYEISSKYNLTGNLEPDYYHYLWKGGSEEFKDNELIKIIEITSTRTGTVFPLNDEQNPNSIKLPSYKVIQVPLFDLRERLIITYIAYHQYLDPEKDLNTEIDLPNNLIKALCSYVAYSIYNNINTQEAVGNANKFYTQYSSAVNKVISTGNAHSTHTEDRTKFSLRGWV